MKSKLHNIIWLFFVLITTNVLLSAASPIITSSPTISVIDGDRYIYDLNATDLDNDTLTWKVKDGTTLPSWLNLTSKIHAQTAISTYQPSDVFINSTGEIYTLKSDTVYKWSKDGNSEVVAGNNGAGSGANQLNFASAIYVDSTGNIYISDFYNHRVQMWVPGASEGVTVAGGNGNGSDSNQLDRPKDVFVDVSGNVYIADYNNHRIQKWTPGSSEGVTVAGGNGYGQNLNQLSIPTSVFVDTNGNVFASNSFHIQKWAPGANEPTIVAGVATTMGSAANELSRPLDIYVTSNGDLYIADGDNQRIQKWSNGASEGETVGGGAGTGTTSSHFNSPTGISLDENGTIYVADQMNNRIQKVARNKSYTLEGQPTSADSGSYDISLILSDGNTSVEHNFQIVINNTAPVITSTPPVSTYKNKLFTHDLTASDSENDRLNWSVKANTNLPSWLSLENSISSYDLNTTVIAGGNGLGADENQFYSPKKFFIDDNSAVFIADYNNHRIQKWTKGAISGVTVAGGNGQGSAANQLDRPSSVFVDSNGTMYIADTYNDRIQKWLVGASEGVTVAGFNGQGDASNQLNNPSDIFVDDEGSMYIADFWNDRVQKWPSHLNFGLTVAGGNGKGSDANQIKSPSGIFVDSKKNIYVSDFYNHRVQKWSPGYSFGITVAGGNGEGSASNQLDYPSDVFVQENGDIFVTDNNRVQRWSPQANSGVSVFPSHGAQSIYIDNNDTVFISSGNNTIEKFFPRKEYLLTGTPNNDDVADHNISLALSDGSYSLDYEFTLEVKNTTVEFLNNDYSEHNVTGIDLNSTNNNYNLDALELNDNDHNLTIDVEDGNYTIKIDEKLSSDYVVDWFYNFSNQKLYPDSDGSSAYKKTIDNLSDSIISINLDKSNWEYYKFSGNLLSNNKNIIQVKLLYENGLVFESNVTQNGEFSVDYSEKGNYEIQLVSDENTTWYYNSNTQDLDKTSTGSSVNISDGNVSSLLVDYNISEATYEDITFENFSYGWKNRKYLEIHNVIGNDASKSDANTTIVEAYNKEGFQSRAEARTEFSEARNSISTIMEIKEANDYSEIKMMSVMTNINSNNERIYSNITFKDNSISYYVGRYDSEGESELERYQNSIISTGDTDSNNGAYKYKVKVEVSGTSIYFDVSKINGNTLEVIENYTQHVVTIADDSLDLGIDKVGFRVQSHLPWGATNLAEDTKLEVSSFYANALSNFVSFGYNWENRKLYEMNKVTGNDAQKSVNNTILVDAYNKIAALSRAEARTKYTHEKNVIESIVSIKEANDFSQIRKISVMKDINENNERIYANLEFRKNSIRYSVSRTDSEGYVDLELYESGEIAVLDTRSTNAAFKFKTKVEIIGSTIYFNVSKIDGNTEQLIENYVQKAIVIADGSLKLGVDMVSFRAHSDLTSESSLPGEDTKIEVYSFSSIGEFDNNTTQITLTNVDLNEHKLVNIDLHSSSSDYTLNLNEVQDGNNTISLDISDGEYAIKIDENITTIDGNTTRIDWFYNFDDDKVYPDINASSGFTNDLNTTVTLDLDNDNWQYYKFTGNLQNNQNIVQVKLVYATGLVFDTNVTGDSSFSIDYSERGSYEVQLIADDNSTWYYNASTQDFNTTSSGSYISLSDTNSSIVYLDVNSTSGVDNNDTNNTSSTIVTIENKNISPEHKELNKIWEKTYGLSNAGDYAHRIIKTSDGNFVTIGYLNNNHLGTSNDTYVKKFTSAGTELWSKNIGDSSIDNGYDIKETNDNGFIVTGAKHNGSNFNAWVVKLDANGNKVWERVFTDNSYNQSYSILEVSTGGYVFVRQVNSDGSHIIKLDNNGTTQWDSKVGWCHSDYLYSITETSDGNFVAAGFTYCRDANTSNQLFEDYAIAIKVDANGNELWKKSYVDYHSMFYTVKELKNKQLMFAGYRTPTDNSATDAWLVKTDLDGNIVHQNSYRKFSDPYDYPSYPIEDKIFDFVETEDEKIVFSGCVGQTAQGYWSCREIWMGQVDSNGTFEWDSSFGNQGSSYSPENSLVVDGQDIYYTGSNNADYYVAKLSLDNNSTRDNNTTQITLTNVDLNEHKIVYVELHEPSVDYHLDVNQLHDGNNTFILDISDGNYTVKIDENVSESHRIDWFYNFEDDKIYPDINASAGFTNDLNTTVTLDLHNDNWQYYKFTGNLQNNQNIVQVKLVYATGLVFDTNVTGDSSFSIDYSERGSYEVQLIADDNSTWYYNANSQDFNTTSSGSYISLSDTNTSSVLTSFDIASSSIVDSNDTNNTSSTIVTIENKNISPEHKELNKIWEKTYSSGYAHRIIKTSDGNIVSIGTIHPSNATIKKYTPNGTETWSKNIGNGSAHDIKETSDNGFIVIGKKYNGSSNDTWVIKLDSYGNLQWDKVFSNNSYDQSYSILEVSTGGYVFARQINNDGSHIVKLDNSGTTQWSSKVGWCQSDYLHSITETSDGNFVAAGFTYCGDANDGDYAEDFAIAIKVDANGNELWKKSYVDYHSMFYTVKELKNNQLMFAGYRTPTDNSATDAWLVKTDSDGNIVHQNSYRKFADPYDYPSYPIEDKIFDFVETEDEKIVFSGCVGQTAQGYWNCREIWMGQVDSNGTFEWDASFGNQHSSYYPENSLVVDGDDIYYTGSNNSDYYVAKLSLDNNSTIDQNITLSTNSITFLDQEINTTSSTLDVNITNTGNVDVNITNINLIGTHSDEFNITSICSGVLDTNSSCSIDVTFTPLTVGDKNATVEVISDGNITLAEFGIFGTAINVQVNTDIDNDGMSNEYEVANGLNPNVNDASLDLDNDGVSNYQEFLDGTQPNNEYSKTYTIELKTGWNLISMPADIDLNINTLNNSYITTVRSFQNDQWYVWTSSNTNTSDLVLSAMTDGNGYWVKTTQDTSLSFISHSAPDSISITADGKWKMLGSYEISDINQFFDNNPNITMIWSYSNGAWQARSKKQDVNSDLYDQNITSLTNLSSNEGFLVK